MLIEGRGKSETAPIVNIWIFQIFKLVEIMHALKTLDKCEKEKWIRKTKKTRWEFHQTNHVKQNSFPITNWSLIYFIFVFLLLKRSFLMFPQLKPNVANLLEKRTWGWARSWDKARIFKKIIYKVVVSIWEKFFPAEAFKIKKS